MSKTWLVRDMVRVLRSVPALPASAPALAMAQTRPTALHRQLTKLTARGRCSTLIAERMPDVGVEDPLHGAGLRHRAATPPLRRLAAASPTTATDLRGCAGWLSRRHDSDTAARSVIAAAAGDDSDDNDIRWERRDAFSNPACPPAIMWACTQVDYVMRVETASNKNAPAAVLQILARDNLDEVRTAATINPACPADTLTVLARDDDTATRGCVASNINCPPALLAALAEDSSLNVRTRVAANPSAPPETLLQLADDPDSIVRVMLAHNNACPQQLLQRLANDSEARVRAAALTVWRSQDQSGGLQRPPPPSRFAAVTEISEPVS